MKTYLNSNDGQTEEYKEEAAIPPIRYLRIVAHQLCMDVILLHPDPLDTVQQATPVVQECVHHDARRQRKRKEICDGISGGEVQGRVLFVCGEVEGVIWREEARDVVDVAETVVGLVRGDRKV